MPKQINVHRLGDLVKISSGTTPSKENKNNWGGQMPWISASSMKKKSLHDSALKLTEQGIENGAKLAESGDVLLLVRGSELHNSIPVGIATRQVAFNQDIKSLRCNGTINSEFLYYWLKAMEGVLLNKVESTGIGAGKIDTEVLSSLQVNLPDLSTQSEIAAQFKALDDKIELNRKMNETLEQMTMALFKSWFVDFDPVHAKAAGRQPAGMDKTIADLFPNSFIESEMGRIPKGWSMSTIGKELTTILGGTPSRAKPEYWTNGTVAWINSGKANEFRITDPSEWITQEALQNSATKLLPKRTTILAITGATLGQVSVTEIECCANQSVIGIISSNQFPTEYIYPWVKEKIGILIASQTGGAQQHVNKGNVEDLPLLCPDLKVVEAYTATAKPIFNQIANNCFQTRTLATLRDTLLPKLLSGENPLPVKQ